MRILLITTSYNGLCQRAHLELEELGHEVSISLSVSEDEMRLAVLLFQPFARIAARVLIAINRHRRLSHLKPKLL